MSLAVQETSEELDNVSGGVKQGFAYDGRNRGGLHRRALVDKMLRKPGQTGTLAS
jgi:hypothetical protein